MTELRDVVVCSPLRTPGGRMGGALAPVPALELAPTVLTALRERTGVDPAAIAGVIAAQGDPTMEAPAIGRVAALDAGFPVETSGYQRPWTWTVGRSFSQRTPVYGATLA